MPEERTIPMAGGTTGIQTDYVERGSDEHAHLLGLRKWREGDPADLKVDSWTFEDLTTLAQYAPSALSRDIARAILTQRVAELGTEPIEVRETAGRSRSYIEKGKIIIEAPPMFDPDRQARR